MNGKGEEELKGKSCEEKQEEKGKKSMLQKRLSSVSSNHQRELTQKT